MARLTSSSVSSGPNAAVRRASSVRVSRSSSTGNDSPRSAAVDSMSSVSVSRLIHGHSTAGGKGISRCASTVTPKRATTQPRSMSEGESAETAYELPHDADAVREALVAWYEADHRSFPWRETDDAYAILVCEVMSQQTQLERVVDAWNAFLDRWPTARSLATA